MDTTFAQRLTQACDDSPLVPDYGQGRQITIAEKLNVSQESARKYFHGSVPRPKKMKILAEFLGVSEAWLTYGTSNAIDRTTRRELTRVTKGAIHLLAGMISLEGGNFAFPGPEDERSSFVDLYAIKDGLKVDFHVSVGRKIENDEHPNQYEFTLPREYKSVHVLGLVYLTGGEVEWINMDQGLIEAHKQPNDGDVRIVMERNNGKFTSGNDKWDRFKTIGEIL
jgi:transcriptional regulator with XRE-family HTH domain